MRYIKLVSKTYDDEILKEVIDLKEDLDAKTAADAIKFENTLIGEPDMLFVFEELTEEAFMRYKKKFEASEDY